MCGIAGFAGPLTLASEARQILGRMTDALAHRGPDGHGHHLDPAARLALGHRRLSIVDLEGGAQPMHTADGSLSIVFNGEIYNHAELRSELETLGHRFQTDHSDTEVLLHGYRQWGERLTERLNGMWAFVIHDHPARRLFASRDRFGKKPFYYHHSGPHFAFASELSALRPHPAVSSAIDPLALRKYFAYNFIPAPLSILQGVRKLPAAHSLTYDLETSELRVWRHWRYLLEPREGSELPDEDALADELRHLLDRAVHRRLMADVPLGIFLSGGIDSSAIAALAARHVPEGQLHTFSIGFTEQSFNETSHARLVARHLRTDHHEDILDLDTARALLPSIVARLDEPFGDSSLLPTHLLARFARHRVTVALGGDGGDELFAGYDPFLALRAADLYTRFVPSPLHHALRLLASRLPVSTRNVSFDFKIRRTLRGLSYPPPLQLPVWMGALEPDDIAQLLGSPLDPHELYSEAIEIYDSCPQKNPVDRALQFFTELYLQDGILTKADRATMMNSLEARSPFLDLEVANFARRLPHAYKLRGRQTKYLLKKAVAPLIPSEIITRPKKGFGVPIARWLRDDPASLLPPDPAAPVPGGMNPELANSLQQAHQLGQTNEAIFLWSWRLLGAWNTANL